MNNLKKMPKAWLLDMDGTLYLSDQMLLGANELINYFNTQNIAYCLFTNNSSRSQNGYFQKLKGLGLEVKKENILTSALATILWLKKQAYKNIFLLAVPEVRQEFAEAGFNLNETNPECVVLAFDQTLDFNKLCLAHKFISEGLPFIATHPDLVCPTKEGSIPDCGSMIALLKASTNKEPLIIGKPEKPMVDMAALLLDSQPEEMAIVGDRLYTDIKMGLDNNLTTFLLLSGETKKENLKNAKIKANYIFDTAKDLLNFIISLDQIS